MDTKSLKALRHRTARVFVDTFHYTRDAHVSVYAASLAYTTILSLIPLLAVSFAIFQSFGGLDKLYGVIEPIIIENLAENSGEQAMNTIRTFISKLHVGAIGVGGFIALLFTSMSLLANAEKVILRIWGQKPIRSLFQRVSYYWLIITLGPLALAIVLGAATSKELKFSFLPGGFSQFGIAIGIFFIIYKFVPQCKVRFSSALIGAIFTGCAWAAARSLYGLYVKNVVSYDKIYGSLGALPIMILWIWLLWVIILTGASISAALQKRLEIKT